MSKKLYYQNKLKKCVNNIKTARKIKKKKKSENLKSFMKVFLN